MLVIMRPSFYGGAIAASVHDITGGQTKLIGVLGPKDKIAYQVEASECTRVSTFRCVRCGYARVQDSRSATMKRVLPSSIVLAMLFASGCASIHATMLGAPRPAIAVEQVRVFQVPPKRYEEIARLDASSAIGFGTQGQANAAINRLRREAAKLGADGVLLLGVDTYAPPVSMGVGAGSYRTPCRWLGRHRHSDRAEARRRRRDPRHRGIAAERVSGCLGVGRRRRTARALAGRCRANHASIGPVISVVTIAITSSIVNSCGRSGRHRGRP